MSVISLLYLHINTSKVCLEKHVFNCQRKEIVPSEVPWSEACVISKTV